VQRAHTRDQVLTGFLVDAGDEVRVFKRELSQDLNQLRKVPVELRLYSYRDDWLGDVVYSFEGNELFHGGQGFPRLYILQPKKSWNVTSAKMSDNLTLWSHVDSHLLDSSLCARVDQKHWLSIGNSAREQATRRNDSGLRVHDDIRDRH